MFLEKKNQRCWFEYIYEIYEYLFYRTYIWQLRLWGEKRLPEVAGLLLPTSLFTFVFVGPIVGVLHSLEVPNNEELGILLAVIFTFVAHRLFMVLIYISTLEILPSSEGFLFNYTYL